MENAGPDDAKNFPFLLIGNKLDREAERKVDTSEGQDWAKSHNNILFFEASAKEGLSVETAFLEVARKGVKRMENVSAFSMPDSIGGASGAIKLNAGLSGGAASGGAASGGSRGATR